MGPKSDGLAGIVTVLEECTICTAVAPDDVFTVASRNLRYPGSLRATIA
jgi:hypothetical protein